MPTTKHQRRLITLTDRASDQTEAPDRRLRAAKSLVELGKFSVRTCATARRVANELIGDTAMPKELRGAAVNLLEKIAVGQAARKNEPEPSEEDLEFETAAIALDVAPLQPPAPTTQRRSFGVNTFDEAARLIEGLATFDFSDPRGLEVVPDFPWMNYQMQLVESVGGLYVPHDLCRDVGGEWRPEQRRTWPVEKFREAIVRFADYHCDPKLPPQYRITNAWKVEKITPPARSGNFTLSALKVIL